MLASCLLATLLSAALATSARAVTYWVSPTGSTGASGADSLGNAKTLAWFNANAKAGDVCRFKSGTYADAINPAVSGTATSRIRYYGFPQNPRAVTVADVQFGYAHGSYCTARWFTVPGAMTGCNQAGGMYPVADSIVKCVALNGGVGIHGKQCVLDSLTLTGSITGTGQNHFVDLSGTRDHNNGTIGEWTNGALNNEFKNSVVTATVNTTGGQGDVQVMFCAAAAYNQVVGNTFNITVQNCFGYFFALESYEVYFTQFQGNTWNIALNGSIGGSHSVWTHRDSSSYNRYTENTVNVTGTGAQLSFMLSNPGSFNATTGHNFYGNNRIFDHSPQGGTGVFWYYDGSRNDTIQYNTIATDSSTPCLIVDTGGSIDGAVIRHNTFYTGGSTAINLTSATAVNNPRLTSNIVYCRGTNGSGAENIRLPAGVRVDSAGVFFSLGASTAARAVSVAGADGAPGSGGNFGIAGKAMWGSPRFTDSTYTTFDGRLTASSAAVNASLTDGFAGAFPFVSGSDVTPPATVSDLASSQPTQTSIVVGWTAPGDDGMTGTAAVYDLRWSLSPISAANFSTATPVAPQPVPVLAGLPQSYVMLSLTQNTTYYFALRARDAAGNWSAVSNGASGTTTADTIPPAAIQDLTPGP